METNFQPELGQHGFEEFEKETQYTDASNMKRFVNYLIDRLLGTLFAFLFFMLLDVVVPGIADYLSNISRLEDMFWTSLLILTYYSVLEIISRRTIGKLLTKTKVVAEEGYELDTNRIIIRNLCRLIPLNAISIFFNDGRPWHDSISKTRVVIIED